MQWYESQSKGMMDDVDDLETKSLLGSFFNCCRSDHSVNASSRKKIKRDYFEQTNAQPYQQRYREPVLLEAVEDDDDVSYGIFRKSRTNKSQ